LDAATTTRRRPHRASTEGDRTFPKSFDEERGMQHQLFLVESREEALAHPPIFGEAEDDPRLEQTTPERTVTSASSSSEHPKKRDTEDSRSALARLRGSGGEATSFRRRVGAHAPARRVRGWGGG